MMISGVDALMARWYICRRRLWIKTLEVAFQIFLIKQSRTVHMEVKEWRDG